MIRPCRDDDFEAIFEIVNGAGEAYRDVIPPDRWNEPYMSREELRHEIAEGVRFWGVEEDGELLGVTGIQDVDDVTLVRHAYVRTRHRRRSIGSQLLDHLRTLTTKPILMGTWAAATWAIRFYEKHGFRLVTHQEKETHDETSLADHHGTDPGCLHEQWGARRGRKRPSAGLRPGGAIQHAGKGQDPAP